MADSIAEKVAQKSLSGARNKESGVSAADKVAHKYLHQRGTPTRVAARFIEARGTPDPDRMDGKIVGKDARLYWNRNYFYIEELPQKGKKRLYQGSLDIHNAAYQHNFLLPENILRDARIGSGDNYKSMQKKILKALDKAAKDAADPKAVARYGEMPDWMKKWQWYGDEVYYLNVRPEGVEPFTAMGKDFQVTVKWDSFSAYSPNSDLENHDPSYTKMHQKSPGAARKMYKILKANPEALRSVSWSDFDKWLKKNKVGYDYSFSTWR